jgi:hypothetical protein
MHLILILGEARGIQLRKNGCMLKGCPTTGQSVVILNISCELAHLHVFAYFLIKQINKLCFLHLSLRVISVFLKRQRSLLQNGDVTLVRDSKKELRSCRSNYL